MPFLLGIAIFLLASGAKKLTTPLPLIAFSSAVQSAIRVYHTLEGHVIA